MATGESNTAGPQERRGGPKKLWIYVIAATLIVGSLGSLAFLALRPPPSPPSPEQALHFSIISNFDHPVVGTGVMLTVSVLKADNVTVGGTYTGTVHFTSTDPAAILPANTPFTTADVGVKTFANVIVFKPGPVVITVRDISLPITGNITVYGNQVPHAAFAIYPDFLDYRTVTVDADLSYDPDPEGTLTYAWNFGDGNTGSALNITHVYRAAGTYSIRLTVADNYFASNFTQKTYAVIVPSHRLGVRVVDGVGEFHDTATGETFVPRGNNYIRLTEQNGGLYHGTFDVGRYDARRTDLALEKMQRDGYNVIRVFINEGQVGTLSGGLSRPYMANVYDFLLKAKAHGIYTLFALPWLPTAGGYNPDHPPDWFGFNIIYLTSGGISAKQRYLRDFIEALQALNAPLDAVFAYSLDNEAFFDSNLPPLSYGSGQVTTGNGRTYDMAAPEDKQRMMDENLVYWINSLREAVLRVDPAALVTIGFFQPQQPNPTRIGDPRLIRTYYAIADPKVGGSSADFIDLHAYPGFELTLPQYVENFEIGSFTRKPIIMGEFGAFTSIYPSASAAALALEKWQVESCKYGYDGWLPWTWDTDEQPEIWNALSDGEAINRQLSPKNRPNPCLPGILLSLSHGSLSPDGSLEVTGKLTDQVGVPIAGAPVEFSMRPLGGPGQFTEYTLSETVPAGATQANVGFRVNMEGDYPGTSDFFLYKIRYVEGGETTNRVPNGDFSQGFEGWGFWGTGTGRLEPNDLGSRWMLHVNVTPSETAAINSAAFPVTPGVPYFLTFAARVIPAQVGSGYFAIFFTASYEVARLGIPIAPPTVPLGSTTTDSTGAFLITLTGLPFNTLILIARYAGDSSYLPGQSEVVVPAPSG